MQPTQRTGQSRLDQATPASVRLHRCEECYEGGRTGLPARSVFEPPMRTNPLRQPGRELCQDAGEHGSHRSQDQAGARSRPRRAEPHGLDRVGRGRVVRTGSGGCRCRPGAIHERWHAPRASNVIGLPGKRRPPGASCYPPSDSEEGGPDGRRECSTSSKACRDEERSRALAELG